MDAFVFILTFVLSYKFIGNRNNNLNKYGWKNMADNGSGVINFYNLL